jgi:HSP20 family protein
MASYESGLFPDLYGGFGGNPFQLISRISEEMDRIFDGFGMGGMARWPGSATRQVAGRPSSEARGLAGSQGLRELWAPRIEVCERDGKLLIQADLPGVRKDDLDVQIEDDAIVIQGQRHQETTRDERGFYHSERSYGSFYRMIPLPEGVEAEQAHASFRDGVLQIELPMAQPRQRARRLEIREGGTHDAQTYGSSQYGSTQGSGSGMQGHEAHGTQGSGGGIPGSEGGHGQSGSAQRQQSSPSAQQRSEGSSERR